LKYLNNVEIFFKGKQRKSPTSVYEEPADSPLIKIGKKSSKVKYGRDVEPQYPTRRLKTPLKLLRRKFYKSPVKVYKKTSWPPSSRPISTPIAKEQGSSETYKGKGLNNDLTSR
jgi:hypothetical protein